MKRARKSKRHMEHAGASTCLLKFIETTLLNIAVVDPVYYEGVFCTTKNEEVKSTDREAWPADFPYAAKYTEGRVLFKTRWHGWGPAYDTWEPFDNFDEETFKEALKFLAVKLYHAASGDLDTLITAFPDEERLIRSVCAHLTQTLHISRSDFVDTRTEILSKTAPPPIPGKYWYTDYLPEHKRIAFSHFRLPRPLDSPAVLEPGTALARFRGPSLYEINVPLKYRSERLAYIDSLMFGEVVDISSGSSTPESSSIPNKSTAEPFGGLRDTEELVLHGIMHSGRLSLLTDANAPRVLRYLWRPPPMSPTMRLHSCTMLPPYSSYVSLVPDEILDIFQDEDDPLVLLQFKPYYGTGCHAPAWISLSYIDDDFPFLLLNYLATEKISQMIEDQAVSFDLLVSALIWEPNLIDLCCEKYADVLAKVSIEWTTKSSRKDWILLSMEGSCRDCYDALLVLFSSFESSYISTYLDTEKIRGCECRLTVLLPVSADANEALEIVRQFEDITNISYPPFRTHNAEDGSVETADHTLEDAYGVPSSLTTPHLLCDRPIRLAHVIKLILEKQIRCHLASTCREISDHEAYLRRIGASARLDNSYRQPTRIPEPLIPSKDVYMNTQVMENRIWGRFVDRDQEYGSSGSPAMLRRASVRIELSPSTDSEDSALWPETFLLNSESNLFSRKKRLDLLLEYGLLSYGYPSALSPNDTRFEVSIDAWGNLKPTLATGRRGYYVGLDLGVDDVPGQRVCPINEK